MIKILSTLVIAALTLPMVAVEPVEPVTADVKTGTTTITLDETITTLLSNESNAVIFKKAQPARINPGKGTLTYVVSGGSIDLTTGRTEIINSGGITLAKEIVEAPVAPTAAQQPKQYKTATILDPIFEYSQTGTEPVVTVEKISAVIVVNGVSLGRLHVFSVEGSVFAATPVVAPKNGKISVSDLSLKLTSDAVTALNEALGVTAFTADTEIAKADISVKLAASKL
jgi:hypothetical protein